MLKLNLDLWKIEFHMVQQLSHIKQENLIETISLIDQTSYRKICQGIQPIMSAMIHQVQQGHSKEYMIKWWQLLDTQKITRVPSIGCRMIKWLSTINYREIIVWCHQVKEARSALLELNFLIVRDLICQRVREVIRLFQVCLVRRWTTEAA